MTNISLLPSQPKTMTSREIAELTGKEHGHVKRDIIKMFYDLGRGEDVSSFGCTYFDGQNRQQIEYRLPHDEAVCLVSGYDVKARMAVIKRWQELEAAQAPKLPQTMAQALRLAAEQAEQIEQQQAALDAAAPAVEFVDRYVDSTGLKGFRQVAKLLKIKEPEFRAFLHDQKIMYKLGDEWMPYQNHSDAGRFEVKAGTSEINGHAYNSARFTPKGISWVAGEYAKYKLEN